MNSETAMSKYLRNNIIILDLCTDQNHYTCSESEKGVGKDREGGGMVRASRGKAV